MFSGSIPAIPTPFRDDRIDEAALRDHVAWLIEQGSSGLVACGTTGEAASLSQSEHSRIIDICVFEANGKVPVIAGCGSSNTAAALELVHRAKDCGAAAAMVMAPCYVRPDQRGIAGHFEDLAMHGGLPMVLYNVPARTGVDILPETIGKLVAAFPAIFIALKDATGAIARVSIQRELCGPEFAQLSGNDETALGFMASGGCGCISVTANVVPRLCADFQDACRRQDYRRALDLQDRLSPLHRALFVEPSPSPLKYAMSKVRSGYGAVTRLPLVEIGANSKIVMDAALNRALRKCLA